MGLNAAGGMELATDVLTGTLTSAGGTASNVSMKLMYGLFNAALGGTWSGTMQLQKSFDGGATFIPAQKDLSGTSGTYTGNVVSVLNEPEPGVYYRWQCTVTLTTTGANVCSWRLSGGQKVS